MEYNLPNKTHLQRTWAIMRRILSRGDFFNNPSKFSDKSEPHSNSKSSSVLRSNCSCDRPVAPFSFPRSIKCNASSVICDNFSIFLALSSYQALTKSGVSSVVLKTRRSQQTGRCRANRVNTVQRILHHFVRIITRMRNTYSQIWKQQRVRTHQYELVGLPTEVLLTMKSQFSNTAVHQTTELSDSMRGVKFVRKCDTQFYPTIF